VPAAARTTAAGPSPSTFFGVSLGFFLIQGSYRAGRALIRGGGQIRHLALMAADAFSWMCQVPDVSGFPSGWMCQVSDVSGSACVWFPMCVVPHVSACGCVCRAQASGSSAVWPRASLGMAEAESQMADSGGVAVCSAKRSHPHGGGASVIGFFPSSWLRGVLRAAHLASTDWPRDPQGLSEGPGSL
jgi:hypothetical protein